MSAGPIRALAQAAGLAAGLAISAGAQVPPAGMRLIPAGSYAPLFRSKDVPATLAVPAFYLDVTPVTNAEFLEFVRINPAWRRSQAGPLFAEAGYLGHWSGDLQLGPLAPAESPVVRISWFAARAYARWQGRRLPTTAEWECAASAGFTTGNGPAEPAYREAMLAWFSVPTPAVLPAVGAGRSDIHGVRDLIDLVWEWVDDFNRPLGGTDSPDDNLVCGGAGANAQDFTNYPAFLRAGFRSSLRASYVVPNLGFRCALSP